MKRLGLRRLLSLVTATALLVPVSCGRKAEGGGAGGSGGGGSASAPGGAPAFVEKELSFQDLKLKARVPDGWEETVHTGMFAKAVYSPKGFSFANEFSLSETCSGVCDPAKWLDNAKQEAEEYVGFVNDPQRYMPPARAEVVENGEVEPGKYVLRVDIRPADASSQRKPGAAVIVWRYGADWPSLVKCEFEADETMLGAIDAFRRACLDIEYLGPVAAAN